MTTDPPPTLPDPRTANDDEPANQGRSATEPAEGADDEATQTAGSPAAD